MRVARNFRVERSGGFSPLFLVVLLSSFAILFSAPRTSRAADAATPKYDPHTETKLKGTIEDIKSPPAGHEKEIVYLLIKDADGTLDIYLGPKLFLDDMGIALNKGDEITVTGSKVKQNGDDLVLAREAEKGNDKFVFRDDKGEPVWIWMMKK